MKIKQYDRVLLKEGNKASIVERLEENKTFIVDIDRNGDTDTELIEVREIVGSIDIGKVPLEIMQEELK